MSSAAGRMNQAQAKPRAGDGSEGKPSVPAYTRERTNPTSCPLNTHNPTQHSINAMNKTDEGKNASTGVGGSEQLPGQGGAAFQGKPGWTCRPPFRTSKFQIVVDQRFLCHMSSCGQEPSCPELRQLRISPHREVKDSGGRRFNASLPL